MVIDIIESLFDSAFWINNNKYGAPYLNQYYIFWRKNEEITIWKETAFLHDKFSSELNFLKSCRQEKVQKLISYMVLNALRITKPKKIEQRKAETVTTSQEPDATTRLQKIPIPFV